MPAEETLSFVAVGNGKLAVRGKPGWKLIPRLRELGCTHVVTLLGADEGAEALGQAYQSHGLAWTWLPLPNARYPEGAMHAMLLAALPQLATALDAGDAIMIHCAAGIHRTGMLAYALLRWMGYAPDNAKDMLRKMRPVTSDGMHDRHFAWGDVVAEAQSNLEPYH